MCGGGGGVFFFWGGGRVGKEKWGPGREELLQ